jgi:cbb3-type cytochrome c oxidase subunit III
MLFLALSNLLVGCATESETELVGDADAGAEVYAANCTGCHGADGTGDEANGFPDLTATDDDAEEIEERVRNGEGVMPGYEGTLDDQEIADVVAYVQSL